MRRMATDRWMEAAEAERFRRMALQLPAPPIERRQLSLAVLMMKLRSMARLDIVYSRPVRRITRLLA